MKQDRSIKMGRYSFDEAKHLHTLDGKPLSGVTTVQQVVAKPALIPWAAGMVTKYIEENCEYLEDGSESCYCVTKEQLAEAKVAHTKKKESAGGFGTNVHDAIERWIKTGQLSNLTEEEDKAFGQFIVWQGKNEVCFHSSEQSVFSEKMWIGGIRDLTLSYKGKKYLADIKTSNNVYPEYFAQIAAYDMCEEEISGETIDGYMIIHIPQKGKLQVYVTENKEEYRQEFIDTLNLYRSKKVGEELFKNTKIKTK